MYLSQRKIFALAKDTGIEGIILGRALYEKTIDPKAALQLLGAA